MLQFFIGAFIAAFILFYFTCAAGFTKRQHLYCIKVSVTSVAAVTGINADRKSSIGKMMLSCILAGNNLVGCAIVLPSAER